MKERPTNLVTSLIRARNNTASYYMKVFMSMRFSSKSLDTDITKNYLFDLFLTKNILVISLKLNQEL